MHVEIFMFSQWYILTHTNQVMEPPTLLVNCSNLNPLKVYVCDVLGHSNQLYSLVLATDPEKNCRSERFLKRELSSFANFSSLSLNLEQERPRHKFIRFFNCSGSN